MRTLLYKRTHTGDPNEEGVFGCNDCMKSVRSWDFNAVIGVGGQGEEPMEEDIAFKVTWIGIGAHPLNVPGRTHPVVLFDRFVRYDTRGPLLRELAPHLADLMYVTKARVVMTFSAEEQVEIDKLLDLAKDAPPSQALGGASGTQQICTLPQPTGC